MTDARTVGGAEWLRGETARRETNHRSVKTLGKLFVRLLCVPFVRRHCSYGWGSRAGRHTVLSSSENLFSGSSQQPKSNGLMPVVNAGR